MAAGLLAGCPEPLVGGLSDSDSSHVFFDDIDGDGYGDPATATASIEQPSGTVDNGGDCDDTSTATSPAAVEVCDDIDNNCDGQVDEGVQADFFVDGDGDGYGTDGYGVAACALPSGYAEAAGDCDDSDGWTHPGAEERCDGVQNDCDASGWSLADEDNIATFVAAADGVASDVSGLSGAESLDEAGTLYFCVGTWTVNLTVTADDVSIIGRGDRDTVLSAGGVSSVLYAEGVTGLSVQDVTLTDGSGDVVCEGSKADTCGGAVYLKDVGAVLEDVSVTDSAADSGGGILARDSVLTLDGVQLSGNASVFNGGGVFAITSILSVNDSLIERNHSTVGGGLNVFSGSTLSMSGTAVAGNTATYFGGGVSIIDSTAEVGDSVVSGNAADSPYCTSKNCFGGGFYVGSGSADLVGVTVSGNLAETLGGGVYVATAGAASGEATVFTGNAPDDLYDEATDASTSPDKKGGFSVP